MEPGDVTSSTLLIEKNVITFEKNKTEVKGPVVYLKVSNYTFYNSMTSKHEGWGKKPRGIMIKADDPLIWKEANI